MKLIICIDERKGMMFNKRRQSRDSVLISDVVKSYKGGLDERFLISEYSEELFENSSLEYKVKKNPMKSGKEGDTCFIEDTWDREYEDKIEEIVVYNWNRHYPADTYFHMSLEGFTLVKTDELVGSSHEKITKEIYKK